MPGDRVATAAKTLKPPLKWAGGKRWQVPQLRRLWQSHRDCRLVEPFCGGIAVTLGLAPERALLNDANPHLVNFYRWVQHGLQIDLEMDNDRGLFYRHRARFNELLAGGQSETREAAALFYYLNRTGYNGLCRFNKDGEFNVPFGQYAGIRYLRDFDRYRDALAPWTFISGDVEDVPLEAGDFVYADPPYDVEFRQYARNGFDWHDQERTARRLASHRGPVVLVNQATPRIESLYRSLGYAVAFGSGPRRISCNGNRVPAREIIATRNL
ncbi:MAG TPA: Dam family site-specific DNA-(adenine-N6)-methyltransferase [Vicinamibacterales bacterium]|jgi:DNA adenine methylase